LARFFKKFPVLWLETSSHPTASTTKLFKHLA
jgi:hypothetical protein